MPLISMINKLRDRRSSLAPATILEQEIKRLEEEKESLILSNKLLYYNQERIARSISQLPDGCLITDVSGKIILCNDSFFTLLGITKTDMRGKHITQLSPDNPAVNWIIDIDSASENLHHD